MGAEGTTELSQVSGAAVGRGGGGGGEREVASVNAGDRNNIGSRTPALRL